MKLLKHFAFEAGHFIPDHPTCGQIHGHSYKVTLEVEGPISPSGFVIDFNVLKNTVGFWLKEVFDHKFLNSSFEWSPTAELISVYIFDKCYHLLGSITQDVKVVSVTVWETESNAAVCTMADWALFRHMCKLP